MSSIQVSYRRRNGDCDSAAAGYASRVGARGVPVANFNLEESDARGPCVTYAFAGPSGVNLPQALDIF